jgi:hypothetical protein
MPTDDKPLWRDKQDSSDRPWWAEANIPRRYSQFPGTKRYSWRQKVIVPGPHVDESGTRIAQVAQRPHKPVRGAGRAGSAPHRPVHVVLIGAGQVAHRVYFPHHAAQPIVHVPAGQAERVPLAVALRLRVIPSVFRPTGAAQVGGLGHQRRVHLPHHALPVVGVVVHRAVDRGLTTQAIGPVLEAVRGGAKGAAHHPVLAVPRLRTTPTPQRVPVRDVREAIPKRA